MTLYLVVFSLGAAFGGFAAWVIQGSKVLAARRSEHDALVVADVQTQNANELRHKLDECLKGVGVLNQQIDALTKERNHLRSELKTHETPGQRLGRLGKL